MCRNLAENDIYSTLPPSWSTLSLLEALYLQNNRISTRGGAVPQEWSSMRALRHMCAP